MIQWRPSATGRSLIGVKGRQLRRLVLLTSCIDGAVRLWSDNDDGKVKKTGKDTNDHNKTPRLSFRVVAVVEVNQTLKGALGSDVYVTWAGEFDGIGTRDCSLTNYQYDKTGSCEWLIGVGPQLTVTFWSVHCLDDFAPVRFPRVTLSKKQELVGEDVEWGGLLLEKVFVRRNRVFSPPNMCSLVELLPCNSLAWLQLHSEVSSPEAQEKVNSNSNFHKKDSLSSQTLGILDIDSHAGNILKVVLHPWVFEVGLAASLDTNGVIIFWSLTAACNNTADFPTLNPSSKYSGRIKSSDSFDKYTSLGWTPAVLSEDRVLVTGHAGGIDCFIVRVLESGEKIAYHNLFTIPFGSEDFDQGPTTLCSFPLPSTCNGTYVSNSFILVAIWEHSFRAYSWKVTVHHDSSGNTIDCCCGMKNTAKTFEGDFSGKRYYISVYPFSSVFPSDNKVSCFAVVQPSNNFLSSGVQEGSSADESCYRSAPYHIVTGCNDGRVKLWQSVPALSSSPYAVWNLVGELVAHQGPILAVSPTVCGGKVATVSLSAGRFGTTLHVWESVFIGGVEGKFMLEDTLSFDCKVVTLNWLDLGNGLLLLGVCFQNELKVYAQKHCLEEPVEGNIWVCIAVTRTHAIIRDFFWGPNATIGVINLHYFCLFTHLSLFDNKNTQMRPRESHKDGPFICNGASTEHLPPGVFFDSDIHDAEKPSMQDYPRQFQARTLMNVNSRGGVWQNFDFESTGFWSFSGVAEMLGGPLPAFHPEALLLNIGTGNWKRAYVAVQHLIGNLTSAKTFEKRFCCRKDNQFISQVSLSNYLEGGHVSSKLGEKSSFQWVVSPDEISSPSSQFQREESSAFASSWAYRGTDNNAFPSSSVRSEQPRDFIEVLDKFYDFAGISNDEKMQIQAIIDILQELTSGHTASAYGSLDESGRRFWVAVRFQRLYFTKRHGRSPLAGELVLSSKFIGWAFHSDCQENLFDSLLSNEPSWQEMRDIGVGFWYSNTNLLRVKMEKLARRQYLKTKDPRDCALLYIALNRIQVLAGLFKISKDEKDKPLVAFLSRNFQDEKNRAAALKNAYVLMGKHQLELAAAFFLLGGDTYSAVNVCAKNLGDEQLGLVICRLVDGFAGVLEHNLISKIILPSSISKGDFWLASMLEWILGNYPKAYLRMLGCQMTLTNKESTIPSGRKYLLDPSIGQHCLMLANKTNMKNAVGEPEAGIFSRWAMLMTTVALGRSGMPLEALECLSSFLNAFGAANQVTVSESGHVELLHEVLKLSPHGKSSNWISSDFAKHKELQAKSEFAMNYVSQLLKEHPSWRHINTVCFGRSTYMEPENDEYKRLVNEFIDKVTVTLTYFQQKFTLDTFDLINKIMLFLNSNGLQFVGYHMLVTCISRCVSSMEDYKCEGFIPYGILPRLRSRAFRETSIVSRYIVSSVVACPRSTSWYKKNMAATKRQYQGPGASEVYQCDLLQSLWSLRASVKVFSGSLAEDFLYVIFGVLDVAEYFVYFTSAWNQINLRGLALITKPLLLRYTEGRYSPNDIIKDLKDILYEVRKIVVDDIFFKSVQAFELDEKMLHNLPGDYMTKLPEEERWLVICCSLWGQVLSFLEPMIKLLGEKMEEGCSVISSGEMGAESDIQLRTVLLPFSKLIDVTCGHISVYCAKQLVSNLLLKGDAGVVTIVLSSDDSHTDPSSPSDYSRQRFEQNMLKNETEERASNIFWRICSDPKTIPGFIEENLKWFECLKHKSSRVWGEVYTSILNNCDGGENGQEEDRIKDAGSPIACLTPNDHPFLSSGGDDTKKVVPFDSPREIYKRTGELLEALCINSIDQHQAALATSRKGIIYFHWEDGLLGQDGSEYIWADADWPHNGWAGSESTPVPTCVYPGVGLGSRKGTHLGLGGATVGAGLSMRPAREQRNSVISGYSGMGVSSFGWGIQEDFEQFADPIPTIGSVSSSSFSAHPSMPLFLVGSSNTHVYLWEFGKDRATATYGVLPAANVPPPYALASISAVRFDKCGHRFVTGALDGTICTWQLEVGGRSNVGPTESAVCFDNHTLDVTYVTPSGSIIAAAGYSSTGINVVIWDTLAPNATSRASIMCHEGGTRSLSVFDNNLGSGSVSPLIATGGKAGDVGLHDFRYIATGRTKKHKHNDISEPHGNLSTTVEMQTKTGDQNRNGMLWYIPKAHTGSVTKVCTIPNTSFFLTGSKDGDVKLWDAKRARLIFHWPRLHERHTFLQPSSRGFGGVVRAGVTDIQACSHGFLTCGGDGTVRLIQLKDGFHL
ncbi:OLC1v1038353C2 [Oldenlandia corymbosa var. corymbosa]|nr:OLC1v1038353C2 [Oldenlandia corymbosa var. corymbosa]